MGTPDNLLPNTAWLDFYFWDIDLFPNPSGDVKLKLNLWGSLARPGTTPMCWTFGQGSANAAMANQFDRASTVLPWAKGEKDIEPVVGAEGCVHRWAGDGPWSQVLTVWDDGIDQGNAALIRNDALGRIFFLDSAWLAKYREAGGPAVLGAPASNLFYGGSLRQNFEKGYIILRDGVLTVTLFSDPMPSATPTTSTPTPLPTTTPEPKPVIVYLEGVGSSLGSAETGRDTVAAALEAHGLDADHYPVITYSYRGGYMEALTTPSRWKPFSYDCADTSQWLGFSVAGLKEMLQDYSQAHPGSEFILLGHSLGGVVAWTAAREGIPGLELNNSRIAMVVTMGSPVDRPAFASDVQMLLVVPQFRCAVLGDLETAMIAASLEQNLLGYENNAEAERLEASGVVVLTYASTRDELRLGIGGERLRIETDSGGATCDFGGIFPNGHGNYIHDTLFWDILAPNIRYVFEDVPLRMGC